MEGSSFSEFIQMKMIANLNMGEAYHSYNKFQDDLEAGKIFIGMGFKADGKAIDLAATRMKQTAGDAADAFAQVLSHMSQAAKKADEIAGKYANAKREIQEALAITTRNAEGEVVVKVRAEGTGHKNFLDDLVGELEDAYSKQDEAALDRVLEKLLKFHRSLDAREAGNRKREVEELGKRLERLTRLVAPDKLVTGDQLNDRGEGFLKSSQFKNLTDPKKSGTVLKHATLEEVTEVAMAAPRLKAAEAAEAAAEAALMELENRAQALEKEAAALKGKAKKTESRRAELRGEVNLIRVSPEYTQALDQKTEATGRVRRVRAGMSGMREKYGDAAVNRILQEYEEYASRVAEEASAARGEIEAQLAQVEEALGKERKKRGKQKSLARIEGLEELKAMLEEALKLIQSNQFSEIQALLAKLSERQGLYSAAASATGVGPRLSEKELEARVRQGAAVYQSRAQAEAEKKVATQTAQMPAYTRDTLGVDSIVEFIRGNIENFALGDKSTESSLSGLQNQLTLLRTVLTRMGTTLEGSLSGAAARIEEAFRPQMVQDQATGEMIEGPRPGRGKALETLAELARAQMHRALPTEERLSGDQEIYSALKRSLESIAKQGTRIISPRDIDRTDELLGKLQERFSQKRFDTQGFSREEAIAEGKDAFLKLLPALEGLAARISDLQSRITTRDRDELYSEEELKTQLKDAQDLHHAANRMRDHIEAAVETVGGQNAGKTSRFLAENQLTPKVREFREVLERLTTELTAKKAEVASAKSRTDLEPKEKEALVLGLSAEAEELEGRLNKVRGLFESVANSSSSAADALQTVEYILTRTESQLKERAALEQRLADAQQKRARHQAELDQKQGEYKSARGANRAEIAGDIQILAEWIGKQDQEIDQLVGRLMRPEEFARQGVEMISLSEVAATLSDALGELIPQATQASLAKISRTNEFTPEERRALEQQRQSESATQKAAEREQLKRTSPQLALFLDKLDSLETRRAELDRLLVARKDGRGYRVGEISEAGRQDPRFQDERGNLLKGQALRDAVKQVTAELGFLTSDISRMLAMQPLVERMAETSSRAGQTTSTSAPPSHLQSATAPQPGAATTTTAAQTPPAGAGAMQAAAQSAQQQAGVEAATETAQASREASQVLQEVTQAQKGTTQGVLSWMKQLARGMGALFRGGKGPGEAFLPTDPSQPSAPGTAPTMAVPPLVAPTLEPLQLTIDPSWQAALQSQWASTLQEMEKEWQKTLTRLAQMQLSRASLQALLHDQGARERGFTGAEQMLAQDPAAFNTMAEELRAQYPGDMSLPDFLRKQLSGIKSPVLTPVLNLQGLSTDLAAYLQSHAEQLRIPVQPVLQLDEADIYRQLDAILGGTQTGRSGVAPAARGSATGTPGATEAALPEAPRWARVSGGVYRDAARGWDIVRGDQGAMRGKWVLSTGGGGQDVYASLREAQEAAAAFARTLSPARAEKHEGSTEAAYVPVNHRILSQLQENLASGRISLSGTTRSRVDESVIRSAMEMIPGGFPNLTRGPKSAPLPLPTLKGVRAENVQEAWDLVSARYPRLASLVTQINGVRGKGAPEASWSALDNQLDVRQGRKLTPELLLHEMVHIAQTARGQIVPTDGVLKRDGTRRGAVDPLYAHDNSSVRAIREAYAYRMSMAAARQIAPTELPEGFRVVPHTGTTQIEDREYQNGFRVVDARGRLQEWGASEDEARQAYLQRWHEHRKRVAYNGLVPPAARRNWGAEGEVDPALPGMQQGATPYLTDPKTGRRLRVYHGTVRPFQGGDFRLPDEAGGSSAISDQMNGNVIMFAADRRYAENFALEGGVDTSRAEAERVREALRAQLPKLRKKAEKKYAGDPYKLRRELENLESSAEEWYNVPRTHLKEKGFDLSVLRTREGTAPRVEMRSLSMHRPFDLNERVDPSVLAKLHALAPEDERYMFDPRYHSAKDKNDGLWRNIGAVFGHRNERIDILKQLGYDGVIEGKGKEAIYSVFSPRQIHDPYDRHGYFGESENPLPGMGAAAGTQGRPPFKIQVVVDPETLLASVDAALAVKKKGKKDQDPARTIALGVSAEALEASISDTLRRVGKGKTDAGWPLVEVRASAAALQGSIEEALNRTRKRGKKEVVEPFEIPLAVPNDFAKQISEALNQTTKKGALRPVATIPLAVDAAVLVQSVEAALKRLTSAQLKIPLQISQVGVMADAAQAPVQAVQNDAAQTAAQAAAPAAPAAPAGKKGKAAKGSKKANKGAKKAKSFSFQVADRQALAASLDLQNPEALQNLDAAFKRLGIDAQAGSQLRSHFSDALSVFHTPDPDPTVQSGRTVAAVQQLEEFFKQFSSLTQGFSQTYGAQSGHVKLANAVSSAVGILNSQLRGISTQQLRQGHSGRAQAQALREAQIQQMRREFMEESGREANRFHAFSRTHFAQDISPPPNQWDDRLRRYRQVYAQILNYENQLMGLSQARTYEEKKRALAALENARIEVAKAEDLYALHTLDSRARIRMPRIETGLRDRRDPRTGEVLLGADPEVYSRIATDASGRALQDELSLPAARRRSTDLLRQHLLPAFLHYSRVQDVRRDRLRSRGKFEEANRVEDLHFNDFLERMFSGGATPGMQSALYRSLRLRGGARDAQGQLLSQSAALAAELAPLRPVYGAHAEILGAERKETDQIRLMQRYEALRQYRERNPLSMFRAARGLSYSLGGFGMGIAAGYQVREGVRTNLQLDKELIDIQGVLGGREEDRKILRGAVVESASKYGANLLETAQAAKVLAQAGLGLTQVIQELDYSLMAMRGLGMTIQQMQNLQIAIRAVTGSVDGVSHTLRVMDKIATIEAKYAINAQDIAEAMFKVAPVMQQYAQGIAGIGDAFDYTIALSTTMVESLRISGSQAGDALKFILARLHQPEVSKKLREDFKLRLAANPEGTQMLPIPDVLGEIHSVYEQLKGEGKTARAQELAVLLGGGRRVNAVIAMLEDYGKIQEVASQSARAYGDAQRRAELAMTSTSAQLQQLRNNFSLFAGNLGEATQVAGAFKLGLSALNGLLGGAGKGGGTLEMMLLLAGGGMAASGVRGAGRFLGNVLDASDLGVSVSTVAAMKRTHRLQSLGLAGAEAGAAGAGGLSRGLGALVRLLTPTGALILGLTALAGILGSIYYFWNRRGKELERYQVRVRSFEEMKIWDAPQMQDYQKLAREVGYFDAAQAYQETRGIARPAAGTRMRDLLDTEGVQSWEELLGKVERGERKWEGMRRRVAEAFIADLPVESPVRKYLEGIENVEERTLKAVRLIADAAYTANLRIADSLDQLRQVSERMNADALANFDSRNANLRKTWWQGLTGGFRDLWQTSLQEKFTISAPGQRAGGDDVRAVLGVTRAAGVYDLLPAGLKSRLSESVQGADVQARGDTGSLGQMRGLLSQILPAPMEVLLKNGAAMKELEGVLKRLEGQSRSYAEVLWEWAKAIEAGHKAGTRVGTGTFFEEVERTIETGPRKGEKYKTHQAVTREVTTLEAMQIAARNSFLSGTGDPTLMALAEELNRGSAASTLPVGDPAELFRDFLENRVFKPALSEAKRYAEARLKAEGGDAAALDALDQLASSGKAAERFALATDGTAEALAKLKDRMLDILTDMNQQMRRIGTEYNFSQRNGLQYDLGTELMNAARNTYTRGTNFVGDFRNEILKMISEANSMMVPPGYTSVLRAAAAAVGNRKALRPDAEEEGVNPMLTQALEKSKEYDRLVSKIEKARKVLLQFQKDQVGLADFLKLENGTTPPEAEGLVRLLRDLEKVDVSGATRADVLPLLDYIPRVAEELFKVGQKIKQQQDRYVQSLALGVQWRERQGELTKVQLERERSVAVRLQQQDAYNRSLLDHRLLQLDTLAEISEESRAQAAGKKIELEATYEMNRAIEWQLEKERARNELYQQSSQNLMSALSGIRNAFSLENLGAKIKEGRSAGEDFARTFGNAMLSSLGQVADSFGRMWYDRTLENFVSGMHDALLQLDSVENIFASPETKLANRMREAAEALKGLDENFMRKYVQEMAVLPEALRQALQLDTSPLASAASEWGVIAQGFVGADAGTEWGLAARAALQGAAPGAPVPGAGGTQEGKASPLAGSLDITSRFGDTRGRKYRHTGLDLDGKMGDAIRAAEAGVVEEMGYNSGHGNYVRVRHADGTTLLYGHLQGFQKGLKKGDALPAGAQLGTMGATGNVIPGPGSDGSHVHLEARDAKGNLFDPYARWVRPFREGPLGDRGGPEGDPEKPKPTLPLGAGRSWGPLLPRGGAQVEGSQLLWAGMAQGVAAQRAAAKFLAGRLTEPTFSWVTEAEAAAKAPKPKGVGRSWQALPTPAKAPFLGPEVELPTADLLSTFLSPRATLTLPPAKAPAVVGGAGAASARVDDLWTAGLLDRWRNPLLTDTGPWVQAPLAQDLPPALLGVLAGDPFDPVNLPRLAKPSRMSRLNARYLRNAPTSTLGQMGTQFSGIAGGMAGTALGTRIKGNSQGAQTGSQLGGMVGTVFGQMLLPGIGGALGGMLGGIGGGLLGGLINPKREEPQLQALQAIERAQRETIHTIEVQTDSLLKPESRLLNLPSTFTVPGYLPFGGGGGSGAEGGLLPGGPSASYAPSIEKVEVNFAIHGNLDQLTLAEVETVARRAVADAIHEGLSTGSRGVRR